MWCKGCFFKGEFEFVKGFGSKWSCRVGKVASAASMGLFGDGGCAEAITNGKNQGCRQGLDGGDSTLQWIPDTIFSNGRGCYRDALEKGVCRFVRTAASPSCVAMLLCTCLRRLLFAGWLRNNPATEGLCQPPFLPGSLKVRYVLRAAAPS